MHVTPAQEPSVETDIARYLPLNPRDYLILFALTGGERHGYGLIKDVEEQTGGEVRLDPANLYRSMKRLLKEGFVRESARRRAPDAGDERRRYYAITKLGRRVVQAEATRLDHLATLARSRNLVSRKEGRA